MCHLGTFCLLYYKYCRFEDTTFSHTVFFFASYIVDSFINESKTNQFNEWFTDTLTKTIIGVTCRKSYWKCPGDVGVRYALLKGNNLQICDTVFVVIFAVLVFFIKKETSSATSSFIIKTDGHKLVGINQDSPTVFSVKPQWDIIIVQKWKHNSASTHSHIRKAQYPGPPYRHKTHESTNTDAVPNVGALC